MSMGLYIENMNLPKYGSETIVIWAGGTVQRSGPDIKATEVPEPHGRLVDADEMFVEFVNEGQRSKRYKLGEKWELNGEEIRSVISRLPTIIPTSEEG